MKANLSLPQASVIPNYDARLPAHWKLKRFVDDSLVVEAKATLVEKILLAPFCIGIGLFMVYHAVAIARDILWLAVVGALIFCGIGFCGLHLLLQREIWRISQNLLVIQRSALWPYHSSHSTDGILVITKEETEDGMTWGLKVVAGNRENWLLLRPNTRRSEYSSSVFYPPEFTDLGSFLHEYTGWPLVLPEEDAEQIT
jgi:hypothetical protein